MIKLKDGRADIYQWDTKRILSVPEECSKVHFSNKHFGRSVDVDVVGGEAEIPDFLLQVARPLCVWGFVGAPENGYTKISKIFNVIERNKPADYVFTPTEQITLYDLEQRVEKLEEAGGVAGEDGGYYTPSVTQPNANTMKVEYTASQEDMPAVEGVEIALPIGPQGEAGKTAFASAQEGGYTGTEEAFYAKLAEEAPKLLEVTITENDDGTYTSSHTWDEIKEAYNSGRMPIAVIRSYRFQLFRIMLGTGNVVFGALQDSVYRTINIGRTTVTVEDMAIVTPEDVPDQSPFLLVISAAVNEYGGYPVLGWYDGEEFYEGTDLAACYSAYKQGRLVEARFNGENDPTGGMAIRCTLCDGENALFSLSFVVDGVEQMISAVVQNGIAILQLYLSPSSLPNPNALTINGTTYDGSEAVDMTNAINALIDTKLGVYITDVTALIGGDA